MEARATAQDLYIRDLEHCVRELQRIVDRFRSSSPAAAAAGLLPDDLCDVLIPRAPYLPAADGDVQLKPPASTGTHAHTALFFLFAAVFC